MKKASLYKTIDEKNIRCEACNHFCVISEGKVGLCGVRQNKNGKLNLLVYGKVVAAGVDPIEKKPLFHFLPGSSAYSIGTMGCNFVCGNCQNFDISQMFGQKRTIENYESLNWGYPLSADEIAEEAVDNNCESIAYTYNEPTIWTEYALDVMKLAKNRGLKNVWVSNGYMTSETLDLIIPYLDAINIDIKSFDKNFYLGNCGAKIKPVLDNCKRLVKEKIWLEITTLVIPGLSDDKKMLGNIAGFIRNELGDFVPWHMSAFFGSISWKMKNIASTAKEKIEEAYEIGKKAGLKYVYAGNVLDSDMEDTFCPSCGLKIIDRTGYDILNNAVKSGKCPKCGTEIGGVF